MRDLRNLREVVLEMEPGLNVFVGRNAQGKTSVLEGVGLLARGRSFRTEDTRALIRHGAGPLLARGRARDDERAHDLEIELTGAARRLRVDGREVTPRTYHGRLEAVVYSTDRLRVVRGPMRERRAFLDRGAAALWPAYRQALRDYERVLARSIDGAIGMVVPLTVLVARALDDPGSIDEGSLIAVCLLWSVPVGIALTVLEGKFGQTPGKRLLGIRVVGLDLQPPGIGAAFVRGLLGIADGFFDGLVGIVAVATTPHWQRVGDLVAHTIVIQDDDYEGEYQLR